jgi:hypothetical protein
MSRDEERMLWRTAQVKCVMISCCSGAELQIRSVASGVQDAAILLRELYPTKSDLYARVRDLRGEYGVLTAEA